MELKKHLIQKKSLKGGQKECKTNGEKECK